MSRGWHLNVGISIRLRPIWQCAWVHVTSTWLNTEQWLNWNSNENHKNSYQRQFAKDCIASVVNWQNFCLWWCSRLVMQPKILTNEPKRNAAYLNMMSIKRGFVVHLQSSKLVLLAFNWITMPSSRYISRIWPPYIIVCWVSCSPRLATSASSVEKTTSRLFQHLAVFQRPLRSCWWSTKIEGYQCHFV